MRLLGIIITVLFTTFGFLTFAGFQGINGATNLGVFNKLTCSTGLTCTKSKDSFSIVSSPQVTSGAITVKAATSTGATVDVQANNNASNGDDWQLKSTTSQGGLSFLNNTSGSQVQKMLLDTSGNLTLAGNATATTAATVKAGSSAAATLDIQANANASNGDDWQLKSTTSQGGLQVLNNTSGSQAQKMLLDTSGNLTIAGTFTPTGGMATSATTKTIWGNYSPGATANATSATPSATIVRMSQLWIPHNETVTGVAVLNGATCGTNKWIVALFDSAGTLLANSNTAGALCNGTSAFQKINFTGTYSLVGPKTVWVGVYADGTTDRYFAVPALGAQSGLAGSVTGQTFGTVVSLTPPSTFTADVGPIVYVY